MNCKPENRIPSLFADLENFSFFPDRGNPEISSLWEGAGGVASIKRIAFIGMNIHGLLDYNMHLLRNA